MTTQPSDNSKDPAEARKTLWVSIGLSAVLTLGTFAYVLYSSKSWHAAGIMAAGICYTVWGVMWAYQVIDSTHLKNTATGRRFRIFVFINIVLVAGNLFKLPW